MVLLTVTDAIVKALKKLETQSGRDDAGKDVPGTPPMPSLLAPSIGKPISHSQIINISRQLQSLGHPSYHLDTLLLGSRVYIPPAPPAPEPTPEYKALMAHLRREEESRAYNRMTSPARPHASSSSPPSASYPSPADSGGDDDDDDELTYNSISRQATLIFNILLSVFACAAALWTVARWWATPARLLLSMGGSVLVGVAEVVVYAGYIRRLGEARRKERAVKEVKEVVRSWVVGGGGGGGGGEGEGGKGGGKGGEVGDGEKGHGMEKGSGEGVEAFGSREGLEKRTTTSSLRERKRQKGLTH